MTRSEYRLDIQPLPRAEIVHYASARDCVTSHRNVVTHVTADGDVSDFTIAQPGWKRLALSSRLARRLLRLDKCNVVPVLDDGKCSELIVVRGGRCYHVDLATSLVRPTLKLRQSRNPLHQSICVSGSGEYFMGEYGANPDRTTVPVYRSADGGRTWELAYEFPAGKARHVHGCFWDPFEERIWICSGDFENENHILVADEGFKELEWIGDGSQSFRTCHLLFAKDAVYWGMDSELETSYVCCLDRSTRRVERIKAMPGPVWYAKHLVDGWFLIATVVEAGPSVVDDHAHIFASRDGQNWHDVYRVKKDRWKMPLFKNGVIAFSDGDQTSEAFCFSAEGLLGVDGRAYRARLVGP